MRLSANRFRAAATSRRFKSADMSPHSRIPIHEHFTKPNKAGPKPAFTAFRRGSLRTPLTLRAKTGGLAGTRTLDQCLKRALLYQLSYQPTMEVQCAGWHRNSERREK